MITGSMNLAALTHVKMTKKGKKGNDVTGLFIPLEHNDIKEGKNGGAYLNIVAFEMDKPKEWATHIVKQSFTKQQREKMTDEEQREKPIIGNLQVDKAPPAVNNDAGGGETFSADNDDLPF